MIVCLWSLAVRSQIELEVLRNLSKSGLIIQNKVSCETGGVYFELQKEGAIEKAKEFGYLACLFGWQRDDDVATESDS